MNHRIHYLHRLNREANNLHQVLSHGKETLSLSYLNNIIDSLEELSEIKNLYKKKLAASREEEISRGATIFGPHVDDMLIQINGKDARRFGSQGQQRSAAISLKLSQIEIYYDNTGEYPVILLDDIFSELDEHRRKSILSLLNKTQAFITCTEDIVNEGDVRPENQHIIEIVKGQVRKINKL